MVGSDAADLECCLFLWQDGEWMFDQLEGKAIRYKEFQLQPAIDLIPTRTLLKASIRPKVYNKSHLVNF